MRIVTIGAVLVSVVLAATLAGCSSTRRAAVDAAADPGAAQTTGTVGDCTSAGTQPPQRF